MTDVEEIIEYIKSLKKGFDKDLFQSKIDDLAYVVENEGLDYKDFHTLFKVWLNLSIPITKWVSLGICLVPRERISERTVEYSLRWLMANFENQTNFPRVGFLLDWVTAAMDNNYIDMKALDSGYEIFYTMISYEDLTAYCIKLVYMLTKPNDVTRRRVLELLDYAKKREGKKNMYRQLQVLLGLFKSYKPECVPEHIPSISIYTSFRKLNTALVERFKNCQSKYQHGASLDQQRLFWTNPISLESSKNKKAEPLIPNLEYVNIGSKQYADEQKTYLDFSDPASLVQGALQQPLSRPARLRALLNNPAGVALLAIAPRAEHAFLTHDLHHLFTSCFLDISPHSYAEKQDLLVRLSLFQCTLMQGLPVVTRFLAQYLHFWNEKDFFHEILKLVEWISVDSSEHITSILDSLSKVYYRSQPIEQCAILKAVTTMYSNLVYCSTRKEHYFMSKKSSDANYVHTLELVAAKICEMSDKGLQISPDDIRMLYSGISAVEMRASSEAMGLMTGTVCLTTGLLTGKPGGGTGMAGVLVPALSLLAPSAALLEKAASIILLYKQIFAMLKKMNSTQQYKQQKQILTAYTVDFVNCFCEGYLADRMRGLVFRELNPKLVEKLTNRVPDADAALSIRNHLAFAPYTYMQLQAVDHSQANNRLLFDTVIVQEFNSLSQFVQQAMMDLR